MFEILGIADSIDALAQESVLRARRMDAEIGGALALIDCDSDGWAAICRKIRSSSPRWLAADPVSDAPLADCCADAPAAPESGEPSALACDGSQIPLDRHEIAACYVLNIGRVALHYGDEARAQLSSHATLHFRDHEITLGAGCGGAYIAESDIADERYMAELDALASLAEACAARSDAVAFVDGTLIRWQQEGRTSERRKAVLAKIVETSERCRAANIPLVSYLSRPASREVIGALRVALCSGTVVDGSDCPCRSAPNSACLALDGLRDSDLFLRLLAPGRRSGVFGSRSRVLASYLPAHNKIGFFYFHAGSEVARVEAPLWVLQDPALLARCHRAVHDQVVKGRGYPICLTEAHEQAVVRAADRETFFRLVGRALMRAGHAPQRTAKAETKRRPQL